MCELNSALGTPNGSFYFKSFKDPAGIIVWNTYPIVALWGICSAIAVYGRFIKGYNNLWLIGGYVPVWTYLFYNYARQPTVEIDNAYRYLLAKRTATCELQANQTKFLQNDFTKSEKLGALRAAMQANNLTIYQLEADLVSMINAGTFK